MSSEIYNPNLNIERSEYSAAGFAERYDAYRPRPPAVLPQVLSQLAQVERSQLVVDLGSGTGLSTFVWTERAAQVVGIEPNDTMRRQAESRLDTPNVRFKTGFGHQTGLPDGTADIVTCAQSFRWMEPVSTLAEIARILRPGGVFAAYEYDWPPTVHWEVEQAFVAFLEGVDEIRRSRGIENEMKTWRPEGHLDQMKRSGRFRYARELSLHSAETGTADRLIGMLVSHGYVGRLLSRGLSETELGLDELRRIARRALGDQDVPWYFSYWVRVGVK